MANPTGLHTVMKNLNREVLKIKNRTLKGLIRASIVVRRDMDHSTPKIPVDQGNLRASYFTVTSKGNIEEGQNPQFKGKDAGRLQQDHSRLLMMGRSAIRSMRNPALMMGFSAYYAWYVHEMMGRKNRKINWNRPGSGAKFFETALKKNKSKMLRIIQQEARI